MKYNKTVTLKDGRECVLRNGDCEDGAALLEIFNKTHAQTDFLLTYPEECAYTPEQEAEFLKVKTESDRAVEILAIVDGKPVATAGIEGLENKEKIRHRSDFGISVEKDYWGLGIGRALSEACIECAKKAGFKQLELEVVAGNEAAVSLYKKLGFVEYGRNPKAFRSRYTGWQEVILMRLDLE